MTTPTESPTTPTSTATRAASQARIDANRRNACKSTGPKTAEGKRRARLNALKHGLRAEVVDVAAVEARSAERAQALRAIYRPDQSWGVYACEQAARASVMVERAASMVDFAAEDAAADAESPDRWAESRRAEVARLAARLDRNPGLAVSGLADCPFGIDWLIGQWQMLRLSTEKGDGWDSAQVRLALDLLRFDRRQRQIRPEGAYALTYPDETMPETLGDLCRRMIDRLEAHRGPAAEADEVRRLATVAGLSDRHAPEVRKLRRYESALHRRVEGLLKLLPAPTRPAEADPADDEFATAARPVPAAVDPPDEAKPARPNEANPARPAGSIVGITDGPRLARPVDAGSAEPAVEADDRARRGVEANRNLPTPPSARSGRPDPARLLREAKRRRRRCA